MKSLPFLKSGSTDFCSAVPNRVQYPHIFHIYKLYISTNIERQPV